MNPIQFWELLCKSPNTTWNTYTHWSNAHAAGRLFYVEETIAEIDNNNYTIFQLNRMNNARIYKTRMHVYFLILHNL